MTEPSRHAEQDQQDQQQPPIQWQVLRRPSRGLMCVTAFFGLLFFIAAFLLIPHFMDYTLGWHCTGAGIGLFLAWMLWQSVWAGAVCSVDNDGLCTYGFGGRPNITFQLSDVRSWQLIKSGALRGIGIDINIEKIQILHRKGISINKMRSYQNSLNCSMVLEFLNQDDLETLKALSQQQQ